MIEKRTREGQQNAEAGRHDDKGDTRLRDYGCPKAVVEKHIAALRAIRWKRAGKLKPRKTYRVHGLRKSACRRLAEAGMSASVIASISGHRTLAEVQRYCAAADQERMARQGMAAMVREGANCGLEVTGESCARALARV